MSRLEICSFESTALIPATAKALAESLTAFLDKGSCVLGVSGGSWLEVYRHVVPLLPDNLDSLDIILVDERFGPVGHSQSNQVQLQPFWEACLDRGARFHPMLTTDTSLLEAERQATQHYQPLLSAGPLLLSLGIGVDGHTLSWFPSASLSEYLAIYDHPEPILAITHQSQAVCPERLTLSPAIVSGAASVIAFCQGEAKRPIVEALASTPPPLHRLPAVFLSTLTCPIKLFTDSI